jgi:hypothetical protein
MSTTVHEIAPQVFRVHTPVPPGVVPGGFSFNQFLVVDDAPLLFHTGPRRLFPVVRDAVARGIERNARAHFEKLAATRPVTLAAMHGSTFRGDGGRLLLALADALGA